MVKKSYLVKKLFFKKVQNVLEYDNYLNFNVISVEYIMIKGFLIAFGFIVFIYVGSLLVIKLFFKEKMEKNKRFLILLNTVLPLILSFPIFLIFYEPFFRDKLFHFTNFSRFPFVLCFLLFFAIIILIFDLLCKRKKSFFDRFSLKEKFLLLTFLPAISEECIFRGIFLLPFYHYYRISLFNIPIAVLMGGLLFSFIHITQIFANISSKELVITLFFAFLLGIINGYLLIETGNILYPVLIHFALNSIGILFSKKI